MPDDIEIIGRAIHSAVCDGEHDRLTDDDEAAAHAVLAALSAAGRLLPEGGQTRTEWTATPAPTRYPPRATRVLPTAGEAGVWAAGWTDEYDLCLWSREAQRWPDGSSFTGPWVAVDQEATDAE